MSRIETKKKKLHQIPIKLIHTQLFITIADPTLQCSPHFKTAPYVIKLCGNGSPLHLIKKKEHSNHIHLHRSN